jgi:hypothetical protein
MTNRSGIYLMVSVAIAVVLTISAVVLAPALTSAGGSGAAPAAINPADFSTNITNPLFPLSSLGTKVFEGQDTDPDTGELIDTQLESVVLGKSRKVAGVQVLVLEEKAFADGELVERALDFFAQHQDGTVYYFGESVDNYENGKLVDHDGSWLAGKNGAEPGIIMPADPFVGQTFNQENAPGVAEDQSRVLALDENVKTPAGKFKGCAKFEDTNPLESPPPSEFKWFCPGVGLVRDEDAEGFIELVSYTTIGAGARATAEQISDVDASEGDDGAVDADD